MPTESPHDDAGVPAIARPAPGRGMTARRVAPWLLVAVLLGGGVLYHAKGVWLLFRADGGVDVRLRWQEQWYVMHGQNPYDVTYAALGVGATPWDPARDAAIDPAVGIPDSGGYPPWAFAVGAAFFWPPVAVVKGYFLAVSLLFTAATAGWAYRAVRPAGGPAAGWVGAAAVLGIAAYSTCCHVGQYGAVVVGLLALAAGRLAAGRELAGGLLVGLALLKPTIAGPFALALVTAGRWRAAAACVGWVAVASGAVWWQTRTTPVEMLLQMLAAGAEFVDDSQGLVGVLRRAGLTAGQVTPVLAAGVLLPGAAVLWAVRRRPVLDQFAVAAVVGRLWSYHKHVDNMMLAFLLVALARAAVARPSAATVGGFLAAGAVAWAPASLFRSEGFVFLQLAAWVGGLAVLLTRPPAGPGSADRPPAPPTGEPP